MSNDLTVPQHASTDLLAQMRQVAEIQNEVAAQFDYTYPSAYIRVVHPQSLENQPPGDLQITFNRDDKRYAPVAAVFPVGIIGSVGGRDSSNPTPMQWGVPYTDSRLKEKFQFHVCKSSGNFQPDPIYHDRVLTHPSVADIDGVADPGQTGYVQVARDYNSKELSAIPTTLKIGDVKDCRECTFGRAWFGLKDENGKAPLVLQQVCRQTYAGVVYVVGLMGEGLLQRSSRGLAQIQMSKQAGRLMWDRGPKHSDTVYRQSTRIPQALNTVLNQKSLSDDYPAFAVLFENVVYFFPILIGGVINIEKDKDGNVKGKSALPFAFDTAGTIRKYLNASSESDVKVKFEGAIRQAVDEFCAITQPANAKHYKDQLVALLLEATPRSSDESTLELYFEYTRELTKYHREGGMEKLTTPFQAGAFVSETGEENTTVSPTAMAPSVGTPLSPEAQAQSLQALNNLAALNEAPLFGQEPAEPEIEDDDEDEDSMVASLFFGNLD